MKSTFAEIQRNLAQAQAQNEHLSKLTINMMNEVHKKLHNLIPFDRYQISMPLCCIAFSGNYKSTDKNDFRWLQN